MFKRISKAEDDFAANGASLDDVFKVFEHCSIHVAGRV